MKHILKTDKTLHKNERLYSANDLYRAEVQSDGNFVVYINEFKAIWSTGTDGTKNVTGLVMHNWGAIVLYHRDSDGKVKDVWSSESKGQKCYLEMQDDGNLCIYDKHSNCVWASGSNQVPLPYEPRTNPLFEKMGDQLVKGLAGMLPSPYNKIGAALLPFVFPDKSTYDFQELLDDYTTVVGIIIDDKILKDTLRTQAGTLNSLIDTMTIDYRNDDDEVSKGVILDNTLDDVKKIIGILSNEDFAKIGLSNLITAINLRISIYQELAIRDETVENRNNPKYAKDLKDHLVKDMLNVQNQIKQVEKYINGQRKNYLANISGAIKEHLDIYAAPFYYFKDNNEKAGYRSKDFHNKEDCNDAHEIYCHIVNFGYDKRIETATQWVKNAIEWWSLILINPVPDKH